MTEQITPLEQQPTEVAQIAQPEEVVDRQRTSYEQYISDMEIGMPNPRLYNNGKLPFNRFQFAFIKDFVNCVLNIASDQTIAVPYLDKISKMNIPRNEHHHMNGLRRLAENLDKRYPSYNFAGVVSAISQIDVSKKTYFEMMAYIQDIVKENESKAVLFYKRLKMFSDIVTADNTDMLDNIFAYNSSATLEEPVPVKTSILDF